MRNYLRLIRSELNITQEQLGQIIGIKKSNVSMIENGRATLTERNRNILVQELNVNPDWFDNARADMFTVSKDCIHLSGDRSRRTEVLVPAQSVPLYDTLATAGLVPLFMDHRNFEPVDYIHIPNLPKCDGAVYVTGDSMYPLIKSGDIVLYKQVRDIPDSILWGEMYLLSLDIDGEEYILVKYIQKSDTRDKEGYVKLVSQNAHHAEKEVHISRIHALAIIKASIRMNAIR